jgi:iron complex transport system substrate-binding protein
MSRCTSVFPALCFLLLTAPAALASLPRVVSMHLCADQLLLALAQPQQILSLSYLSADPAWSPIAAAVQGFHLNHGQAEEVLPLAPDLVLTGAFSTTLAANLLERQGLHVERLGIADSIAAQYAQIRQVGQLLGAEAAADSMVQQMRMALAQRIPALHARVQGKRALFYSSNGYSYGRDTLQHDFIQNLGMHNSAAGHSGVAQLPLELLLREAPDYVFVDKAPADEAPLAQALLLHPALAALQGRLQLVVLPDTLFQCAGPNFIDAYPAFEAQLR